MNFENTFLARVPALVENGMSIDDAIVQAMADEENLIGELYNGTSLRSQDIKKVLCVRSYHGIRKGVETLAENKAISQILL